MDERPLQPRAAVTRAALLDAALECLVERGYAETTTIETAKRAGVSRGAQLHHFPTKADLLAAAVGHLLERRVEEYRKAFAQVDPDTDPTEAAIDVLWSMFEGPTFVAWAELWMAARTDAELAKVLLKVDRNFMERCRAIYADLFPDQTDVDYFGQDLAFTLMDGIAFQRLVPADDYRPPADYLAVLKMLAATFGPTATQPTTPEEDR